MENILECYICIHILFFLLNRRIMNKIVISIDLRDYEKSLYCHLVFLVKTKTKATSKHFNA